MIEIVILITFARSLSRMAEAKGRSKSWAGLGVLGWIGGEVVGGVIGALVSGGDGVGAVYAIALLGAVIGAATAYVIVRSLPPEGRVAEAMASHVPPRGVVNPSYDPKNPYSPPRIDE